MSFSQWARQFLTVFSKVNEFVQNSVFCPTCELFVIFVVSAPVFSDFQQSSRVCQNCVFGPRTARFVLFALGAPLFSNFQQSARVCGKQRFLPKINRFCHFRAPKCTSLWKTAFSARDQPVLFFSLWAHQFLAIFNKVHEFVRNSVFLPEVSTFCPFRTGHTTF